MTPIAARSEAVGPGTDGGAEESGVVTRPTLVPRPAGPAPVRARLWTPRAPGRLGTDRAVPPGSGRGGGGRGRGRRGRGRRRRGRRRGRRGAAVRRARGPRRRGGRGRGLLGRAVAGRPRAVLRPGVGPVEPGALEDDADRVEQLAQPT